MATKSTDSIFSAGLILQGRYRLDEPVATGGMAEVWRGHDLVLQRKVAMKLLHPHLASDPAVAERFRREAISAARLSHPHIVPTFDAGTDRGVSYIVLGLVTGPTLADAIKDKPLEPAGAVSIGRQVADALEHAHQNGLVHRDVKPSNILIVDNGGRVMVADFGIAKAVAETTTDSLTLPGLIIGTPGYVAPEQLSGSTYDPRADIFSLGVLLHEMVCGHTEVGRPTQVSPPEIISLDDPNFCPQIPESMKPIVARATAPNPNDRYQTAGEMRDALAEAEIEIHGSVVSVPQIETAPPPETEVRNEPEFPPLQTAKQAPRKGPAVRYDPVPVNRPARGRRITATLIVCLLVMTAIGIGTGLRLLGGSTAHNSPTTSVNPITLVGATSFDPKGSDKVENELAAVNTIDANPDTTWSTETYSSSEFGNLKTGVGLTIHVKGGSKLGQLQVDSPSSGWTATVYVGDGTPTNLPGWGTEVAGESDIPPGTTTFNLQQTSADSILLWITNLGTNNKVTISDVRVTNKPPSSPAE